MSMSIPHALHEGSQAGAPQLSMTDNSSWVYLLLVLSVLIGSHIPCDQKDGALVQAWEGPVLYDANKLRQTQAAPLRAAMLLSPDRED